jgi:triosephosphate isomerase
MAGRTPIIAGNWKMNPPTFEEARALLRGLRERIDGLSGVARVVCPPAIWLFPTQKELDGTDIDIGAQNMHSEMKGAFTGEVSPTMLVEACRYVIIGHSERRHIFGEKDDVISRKVKTALEVGLLPILCVGETRFEREGGRTEEILVQQLFGGLREIDITESLVIAYEPVWAIGTGVPATGEMANEAIELIRNEVENLAAEGVASQVRILYGGSVTGDNVAEFISQPEIDGALVGGASLNAESFASIVRQTAEIKA